MKPLGKLYRLAEVHVKQYTDDYYQSIHVHSTNVIKGKYFVCQLRSETTTHSSANNQKLSIQPINRLHIIN